MGQLCSLISSLARDQKLYYRGILNFSSHSRKIPGRMTHKKNQNLPQKCMNPATFTSVNNTQATTWRQPIKLDSNMRVVKLMQSTASNKFRYNSQDITCKRKEKSKCIVVFHFCISDARMSYLMQVSLFCIKRCMKLWIELSDLKSVAHGLD